MRSRYLITSCIQKLPPFQAGAEPIIYNPLAPDSQDRPEKHQVDQVVPCFDQPDGKTMPGKQFVDQIGGGDKTQPEHETGCHSPSDGIAAHHIHHVEHESDRNGLYKRSNNGEDINHRVAIARLCLALPDASPPGFEENSRMIPDEPA